MKPLILISPSRREASDGLFDYTIRQGYSESVIEAGGIPVLALLGNAEEYSKHFDGLILSGGGDADPSYFGEYPLMDNSDIDLIRDEFEFSLFKSFKSARKPIFGICRGIQLINIAMGGSIWQDIPAQLGIPHSKGSHTVKAARGGFIYSLFGPSFTVNSFHHQSIKKLGRGLNTVCMSTDNIIEAISHVSMPISGVQWHPERMKDDMKPLFDRFVSQCRRGCNND